MIRFLTEKEVVQLTSLSGRTIRRYEAKGTFPPRRRLGDGRVAWVDVEVYQWQAARAIS